MTTAMKRLMALTFVALSLAFAACAPLMQGANEAANVAATSATGPYRLDAGDVVRVIVYNQQSLSTDYKVGDDGTISLPLIGQVKARSLTVQELQKAIYDGLNNGIFVNPGVSVEISQYRPFFVLGEVSKPGQYSYAPGMNVLGAVAVAGGFTVRADNRRMTMIRKVQGSSTEATADPLTELQPGDVIVVREHFF